MAPRPLQGLAEKIEADPAELGPTQQKGLPMPSFSQPRKSNKTINRNRNLDSIVSKNCQKIRTRQRINAAIHAIQRNSETQLFSKKCTGRPNAIND
jgi:hypothetical protein